MAQAFRVDIVECRSARDVRTEVGEVLATYAELLPVNRSARILIKPNLNSNMNALTGNTTDLRLLAAVIEFLQGRGYRNIVIGEGTNSGFYRSRIGVISRLGIDRLARHYGVDVKDLNYAEPVEIDFAGGVKAAVARDCVEADFFINMPKLKTHFEVGMSVCLKNLMGCLVGQPNKKKTHDSLAENILNINKVLKPQLIIVDALVAMEGLGPTRGTPVRLDTVIVGTDPYLIDYLCAVMAGFDYRRVRTLALAESQGLLTPAHRAFAGTLDLRIAARPFLPPTPGPLAAFIHSPRRQKFFLRIRATRFFTCLASTRWFGHLLFLTGLRQDVFLQEELRFEGLALKEGECVQCRVCARVCPLGNDLPGEQGEQGERCLHCLYCYLSCPRRAIEFKGELGFLREQIRQYDERIRRLHED